jgi:hypothetical protein
MRTIALFLAARAVDSKVVIDGHDISDMTTGVDISSHAGEATAITLYLVGNCELLADMADIEVRRPETEPEP